MLPSYRNHASWQSQLSREEKEKKGKKEIKENVPRLYGPTVTAVGRRRAIGQAEFSDSEHIVCVSQRSQSALWSSRTNSFREYYYC
jgi:hypothetical protein